MYSFFPSEPIRKRIQTNVHFGDKITLFGSDNLYPQRMDELYKRSPLTKQAIKVLSEFCMGEGFSSNGDTQLNRYGQTFNDILRLIVDDLNIFNGFSLHFNYNGLGRIIEIQHVPFEYVRLGLKDKQGITDYVAVSSNWEGDALKYTNYEGIEYTNFQLFNPLLAAANAVNNQDGQILYMTPKMFTYPLASFDAMRDIVQAD